MKLSKYGDILVIGDANNVDIAKGAGKIQDFDSKLSLTCGNDGAMSYILRVGVMPRMTISDTVLHCPLMGIWLQQVRIGVTVLM